MVKDKYWRPPPDYYDQEKSEKRKELKKALQDLYDYEVTPEQIKAFISAYNPEISDEELEAAVKLFYAAQRSRGSGRR